MRLVDNNLCKSYRGLPCAACGDIYGTVGHHIKSKGAGGDDADYNLIPLCFIHHRLIHDKSINEFVIKFPHIADILKEKGWEYFNGKWIFEIH